jgi:hypothetical protein
MHRIFMRSKWIPLVYVTLALTSASAGAATVRINEVLASNANLPEIDGTTPDWVELYNDSALSLDLAGWSFNSRGRRWVFPEGRRMDPQGFLVVYFDADIPAGSRNTGFGLNTGGDTLSLYDANTNLVDTVVFGMQVPDFAIGRMGTPPAWKLTVPTRALPNTAAQLGNSASLVINEWMARPASGEDWFELFNPNPNPVEIGGLYLTDDLTKPTLSRIPVLSFIGAGENAFTQFIASGETNLGPNHTNFRLSNSGETIGLYASAMARINSVSFGTQQEGVSEGRLPDGAANNIVKFPSTPSPAESNYLPLTNVWLNEILAHTDLPLEDAIELYNPTDRAIDISGWLLSDSPSDFGKYRIPPTTTIPARGFVVFYENQFGSTQTPNPFDLNSAEGDAVYLSSLNALGNPTGYRASVKFGPTPNSTSLGRLQTSQGIEYALLQQTTFGVDQPATVEQFRQGQGASNAPPLIGPLVINEIMYHPPSQQAGLDNTDDEFIELRNISSQPVPFYDVDYPTNTWRIRGGVSFDFPEGVILGAGGFIVLVNFDPEADDDLADAFRDKFNLPPTIPLFGPLAGKLGNADDEIELRKPDPTQGMGHDNAGLVPYVTVDWAHYTDSAPWPTAADGTGPSLQRQPSGSFGNEPLNWIANTPTAGRSNDGTSQDSDQDGMLDDWETQNGLDPDNPNDAGQDPDQDGSTNVQEFIAGTNPQNPKSTLRLESIQKTGTDILISFTAIQGRSYRLESRDNLVGTLPWRTVTNLGPVSATQPILCRDSHPEAQDSRLYRVVVPSP